MEKTFPLRNLNSELAPFYQEEACAGTSPLPPLTASMQLHLDAEMSAEMPPLRNE